MWLRVDTKWEGGGRVSRKIERAPVPIPQSLR